MTGNILQKETKNGLDFFLSDYDYVFNIVPKDNKITIKWFKWLVLSFQKIIKLLSEMLNVVFLQVYTRGI